MMPKVSNIINGGQKYAVRKQKHKVFGVCFCTKNHDKKQIN